MISQTAKLTWAIALVAALGSSAYWIYSADPVRDAELMLLRDSAEEAGRLAASNRKLEAALPTEDMDALRNANSDLLTLRNQALTLGRDIDGLRKAIETAQPEETPEMKRLVAQNQQLAVARAQREAEIAQAENLAAAQNGTTLALPSGPSAIALASARLRGPDGSLSAEARKALTDAIARYKEEHDGANPASVDDILRNIPADLLNSDQSFEVLTRDANGETVTPGDEIRRRYRSR